MIDFRVADVDRFDGNKVPDGNDVDSLASRVS